jgi:hypothetical protein
MFDRIANLMSEDCVTSQQGALLELLGMDLVRSFSLKSRITG